MTAPDHRPYLLATDLRTAEDVARWLHEIDDDDITGGDPMWLTISRLDARLDRERRQACRRGALACWRAFCDEAGNIDWTAESLDVWGCRRRALGSLTRALAFRAAARQP